MRCVWTKLVTEADEEHGKPCSRSSHGLSYLHAGGKLILYGGEHIARTPLDGDQAAWALSLTTTTTTTTTTDDSKGNPKWRKLPDGPPSRIAHAQAVHKGNTLFVFGGRGGITMSEKPFNDMWKLNCETEVWEELQCKGEAPEPRSFHKMVCLGDSLYVFGGCGPSGRLADLYRYDINESTWHALGKSPLLRGRGGANLIVLQEGNALGIVGGFAGEETADGHVYDLVTNKWSESLLDYTTDENMMRPRSVSACAPLSSKNRVVIFGGEVDPSDRGHEGAGGFTNDIVILDNTAGGVVQTIIASGENWPESRGWSDATVNTEGRIFLYGGLTGDDANPRRLDDLWQCEFLPE